MELIDYYKNKCKETDYLQVLQCVQEEIERRYGVISDETKIEPTFFYMQDGMLKPNQEFIKFYQFLSILEKDIYLREDVKKRSALMYFIDEMKGWNAQSQLDENYRNTDPLILDAAKSLCHLIGDIFLKKKLEVYYDVNGSWILREKFLMRDYIDGETTFLDIRVQNCLIEGLRQKALVILEVEKETKIKYGFYLSKGVWSICPDAELELIKA